VCNSWTCAGCCAGNECKAGNAPEFCGTRGQACTVCAANQSCKDGSCSGAGSLSLVQEKALSGAGVTSLALTLAAPPSAGNALILSVNSSTAYPTSVSGGGVTWALGSKSGAHVASSVWVGFRATSGGATVTINLPSPGDVVAHLSEWSGLTGIDVAASKSGTTSPVTTATITTTETNELVFASAATWNVTLGAPTNGFTLLTAAALHDIEVSQAYQMVASTGSYSTAWSQSPVDGWDTQILAFKTSSTTSACASGKMKPVKAFSLFGDTCHVDNLLASDDAWAGLDRNGSEDVRSDVGTVPVVSCAGVDFGAAMALDSVVVRAKAVGRACDYDCFSTATGCGTGRSMVVVLAAQLSGPFENAIGDVILTGSFVDKRYDRPPTTPSVRYVFVCREVWGGERDDVAVDSIHGLCH
jgi:hypothetical protein